MVLTSAKGTCNVYDLCRLCMSEKSPSTKMMKITNTYPTGSNFQISEMIMECLSIDVKDKVSNLLTQVCEDCVIELHTFSDFKNRCNAVDNQLRQIILRSHMMTEAQVLYGPDILDTASDNKKTEAEVSSVASNILHVDDIDVRKAPVDTISETGGTTSSAGRMDISSDEKGNFLTDEDDGLQLNYSAIEYEVVDTPGNQDEGEQKNESNIELMTGVEMYTDEVRDKELKGDGKLEIHVSVDGQPNVVKVVGKIPRSGLYNDVSVCKSNRIPKQTSPSKRFSIPIPEVLVVINEEGLKQLAFRCQECGQTFNNRVLHRGHVASHVKTRGFICEYCDKWFPAKSALVRHERIHSGEKPYTCILCNRSFSQQEILQRHVMTHTDAKPFPCPHCDKGYTQKEALNAHLKSNHRELKKILQYLCPLCDKAFCHKSGLSRHLQLHTGKRHSCEQCTHQFSDISSLRRHQKKAHDVNMSIVPVS